MQCRWLAPSLLSLVLCLHSSSAFADVKLPAIFSDHMVLQADMPVRFWGWAQPDEKVTVTLADQSETATADAQGKWSVKLKPQPASATPLAVKVQGKNSLEIKDVLLGEVWLASGQSNMQRTVKIIEPPNMEAEIKAANHPQLRMFIVTLKNSTKPMDDCVGKWFVCTPENMPNFSATAYFFGRDLHQALNVPVGLVNSSFGGTYIEAWTSTEAQLAVAELKTLVEDYKKKIAAYDPVAAKAKYEEQLAAFQKVEAEGKAAGKPTTMPKPTPPKAPDELNVMPGGLYNGMIHPLAPYSLRGAIWYQGESNSSNPHLYGQQLQTLIASWRSEFQNPDMPFLFVQLPNFREPQKEPQEAPGWALIREQFLKTLRTCPNTGMAVTIDIGQVDNIHPQNKVDVGKRLAQWALAKTYGKPLIPSGPLFTSAEKMDDKFIIHFDYAEGLKIKGDKFDGFVIAGEDKKFTWAQAKIDGETVIVWSPDVKKPVAVRYAWSMNPPAPLYNKADLPASPFRTDDWLGR